MASNNNFFSGKRYLIFSLGSNCQPLEREISMYPKIKNEHWCQSQHDPLEYVVYVMPNDFKNNPKRNNENQWKS